MTNEGHEKAKGILKEFGIAEEFKSRQFDSHYILTILS